ncbi:peroxidase family protein [Halomonas daqiaonensis]|uniref:Animal haem peroxidase n=1 Tax=Halomonas daqiaonensis TaxID=650850 RepID=A0A1H7THY0_9GAMM|nr:peroxidase family protein [Halomonas daqiaonensis]SEL83946.1 Animal haem peroxidase [Halomonas daqiaonensis]
MFGQRGSGLLGRLFRRINRRRQWHQFPFLIAVLNLVALRGNMRWHNLYDTERERPPDPDKGELDVRSCRTADGSYNDLAAPCMGKAYTRFGRNVPIAETFGETDEMLMTPSPRVISRRLMTRETFTPATTLNVLVPAWLQFMVHDWFSHGSNDTEATPYEIPLDEDDDWPWGRMTVLRSRRDSTRGPADEGFPETFLNTETQWWDGSQIYGSSLKRQRLVRSDPESGELLTDGKLYLRPDGHLPQDEHGIELAGVNGNWWVGLSLMHNLFVREHNAIVDRLRIDHPDRDGEWLFQKARLINTALIAKIHTVEWTPALLDTPELRLGMRANWWGILDEHFYRSRGRVSDSELFSGIVGSPVDHHAAPYAITEEFSAVYRMHPLVPDDFDFRRLADDSPLKTCGLTEVAGSRTHSLYDEVPLADALYSLGTSHPGALVLHNFPSHLQQHAKQAPHERTIDLASIDVLRDRERGVPRYCRFRRLIDMPAPASFAELTDNPEWQRELEAVYGNVEQVDLLTGCLAETPPPGFAFSDTAFRIFILMASRRLKSDRFFTDDYIPEVYTPAGMQWIDDNGLRTVIGRHFPELVPRMEGVRNVFFPWSRETRSRE